MIATPVEYLYTFLSFSSDYISKTNTTLSIQCHDRHFRGAIVRDDDPQTTTFFSLTAKQPFTSWSVRRTLKDALDNPILDLRHQHSSLSKWVIEDPNGKVLCIVTDGVEGKFIAAEAAWFV